MLQINFTKLRQDPISIIYHHKIYGKSCNLIGSIDWLYNTVVLLLLRTFERYFNVECRVIVEIESFWIFIQHFNLPHLNYCILVLNRRLLLISILIAHLQKNTGF